MPAIPSYNEAPFAIEYRNNLDDPPSEWMERFRQAGVRATWIGVTSPYGEPRFPSRILPKVPDVPDDFCKRLVDEAHARGICAVSWWPMNHNKTALALHPDWAITPLADPDHHPGGRPDYPTGIFPCPTSPYRDMLHALVVEAIELTGVDGFFFDGVTFGYNGGLFQMACRCERCATRFHAQTGFGMPALVDFNNPAFRRFIRWQYDLWKAHVRDLANAIHHVKPGAYVGLNIFNRPPDLDFHGGSPIEELCDCDVTPCVELGWAPTYPYEASSMMCKLYRAMQPRRPGSAELYAGLLGWVEEGNRQAQTNLLSNALTAIVHGCCVSFGTDDPIARQGNLVRELTDALAGPRAWVGGTPLPYIAVHFSNPTKDFVYQFEHMRYWDKVNSIHEILSEGHVAFDYILDDQLLTGRLSQFSIAVLPDSTCLSEAQTQALSHFVQQGGMLVACGDVSTADEWGEAHDDFALSEVLGVTRLNFRKPCPESAAWRLTEPLDAYGTDTIRLGIATTPIALRPGSNGSNATVIATMLSDGMPAVVSNRWGKGTAVYVNCNLGRSYFDTPRSAIGKFLFGALMRLAPPPLEVEAPWFALMDAYRVSDGELRVHLDTNRGRPRRAWHATPPIPAQATIYLRSAKPRAASLPLTNQSLPVASCGDRWAISLPQLGRYDVAQILI